MTVDINIPEGPTDKEIAEVKARLDVYREIKDEFAVLYAKVRDSTPQNLIQVLTKDYNEALPFIMAVKQMIKINETKNHYIELLERRNVALENVLRGTIETK